METETRIKPKRKFRNDENAITTIAAIGTVILLLSGAGLFALAVSALSGGETTVYNVSDTGFSLAGFDIDATTLILIIISIIGLLAFMWYMKK